MTREEFAAEYDGVQYPWDPPTGVNNLVIVYGASDDLVEFEGAFVDEAGLGTIYVHRHGVLPAHERCECEHCGYRHLADWCARLTASFGDKGIELSISVPSSNFRVMEGDEEYGRALVVDVNDLPRLL